MRTDHLAYQQATRVAGFGLLLQLGIGLVMLVYGFIFADSSFQIASMPVLVGVIVWMALVIVFHQHRLERLEALERDELAAERGEEGGGIFSEGDTDVAARRLRLMHTWLMPAASLLVAALLVWLGLGTITWFGKLDDPEMQVTPFGVGANLGWQLAIALGLALVAFIFSRFVAGMAARPAWANLRGGAGHMVGNALVLLAVAIGIAFRFFEKPAVLESVAFGLAIYMLLLAAEIVLNFVLNLYRPRRPGEVPRPAFDSRILSLFAAPDSIVRSINEAVNYQFGFDITSSWGYQLLLRSGVWLLVFAVGILVALSSIVVVEPGHQAVRLRGGAVVGKVHEGSLFLKWPWPFETVVSMDAARVREISLNGTPREVGEVFLWDPNQESDNPLFLVTADPLPNEIARTVDRLVTDVDAVETVAGPDEATPGAGPQVSNQFALVDADIILRYRVRPGGLIDYLTFCNGVKPRRSTLDMREQSLQDLALRMVTQTLSTLSLEDVLSPRGSTLPTTLRGRVQDVFDEAGTGVEVVSIAIPALRPPNEAVTMFEELSIDTQNSQKTLEEARRMADSSLAALVGDADLARTVVERIRDLLALEAEKGRDDPQAIAERIAIQSVLRDSPGMISSFLASARSLRWKIHMEARRNAAEVLGQVASYAASPEVYRQRRIMDVFKDSLPGLRAKYVLGVDPRRTDLDFEMQEPSQGLDLRDYLDEGADSGS
jgi:regulator of protease activity HflC (stomatin/prohibitin superfamily)